ncbi:hypothetical protein IQ07DRAFT_406276 [Pyrenochaeta sp. DS3sAY3a]|nr:hypothetical protein IQ07DRAFT_406276 [Pyrenochaeta sp. DS3sAY3a]
MRAKWRKKRVRRLKRKRRKTRARSTQQINYSPLNLSIYHLDLERTRLTNTTFSMHSLSASSQHLFNALRNPELRFTSYNKHVARERQSYYRRSDGAGPGNFRGCWSMIR